MLLGFILEDAHGASGQPGRFNQAATLSAQFRRVASFVTAEPLTFNPPRPWRPRTAPTELDPWRGRMLIGEVHDENAWALGGAAGHAGLFGTAGAVGSFAQAVLQTIAGERLLAEPSTFREFIRRNRCAWQLAGPRLGHDAADLVMRHADVVHLYRPHRFHRHVAVD